MARRCLLRVREAPAQVVMLETQLGRVVMVVQQTPIQTGQLLEAWLVLVRSVGYLALHTRLCKRQVEVDRATLTQEIQSVVVALEVRLVVVVVVPRLTALLMGPVVLVDGATSES
jgi:hypothetical protein